MLIESLSGVRAHDTKLTDTFLKSYAAAFCKKVNAKRIVVGRDTRESGNRISKVLIEGLREAGAKVINIGICPTPTVQFAAYYHQAQGGVCITASHNPLPWNGLKFINSDGAFLNGEQMAELQEDRKEIEGNLPTAPTDLPELIEYNEAISDHITHITTSNYINVDNIKAKKYKVVFDGINGGAFEAGPALLEQLGCEVVKINCDGNKPFPRTPEPLPEFMTELEDKVKAEKADIGFAVDPDGDRLAIVSNEGKAIPDEYTLVLAAKLVLSRVICAEKEIVTNLSTTMAIDKIAEEFNADVIRTPVGEINVVEILNEENALIGGEGNGGVILPNVHRGRDALIGMALILQLLVSENKTISQVMETIPQFIMVKKKVETQNNDILSSLEEILEIAPTEDYVTEDGIKLIYEESWVHMRASNTEPIIRIYAEAKTEEEANGLAEKFIQYFKS